MSKPKSSMTLPQAKTDCKERFVSHREQGKSLDPQSYFRGYFNKAFTQQFKK